MKTLFTVFVRLSTPLSIRVCSLPGSLPLAEKNAMRKVSIFSMTACARSRETRMRIRIPKYFCANPIRTVRTSLPRSTMEMIVRMRAALDHAKSLAVTSALTESTVLSSTMALTWANKELMRVRARVAITSHL